MDILSLNKLFAIPEFLVIRNLKREQNELLKFNTVYPQDEFGGEFMHETENNKIEESKKDSIEEKHNIEEHNQLNGEFDSNQCNGVECDINKELDQNKLDGEKIEFSKANSEIIVTAIESEEISKCNNDVNIETKVAQLIIQNS